MKIAIVIGTRPEIIKMASVIDEIQKRNFEMVLLHTGQHYDKEMSDNFFTDLKLPNPKYNIHVGSGTHGKQTGLMMEGIEEILTDEKPDILLVQGDTNAVLAGALVASKLHIPVGHVEAGLRSFDNSMPEEINRKVADVCSQMFFVPTEESAINLLSEEIPKEEIFLTGNTIVDACFRNLEIAKDKNTNESLYDLSNILTVTMHRAENVDNKERLSSIVQALKELTAMNIIFPIHPRTKIALEKFNLLKDLENSEHIHLTLPMGYLEFLLLLSKSSLILTDSGGLQEEAITLNIPTLTLRYNTERPETVSAGGNILVGADKEKILEYTNKILNDADFRETMKNAQNPYGDGKSGEKILDAIEKSYNKGLLNIQSPEDIMVLFKKKIINVKENITVNEFEKKYNTRIKLVYDNKMHFPFDNLNLNNMMVVYDQYET